MGGRLFWASVVVLIVSGAVAAREVEKAELADLQGVWEVEELEIGGTKNSGAKLEGIKLIIARQYMTYHIGNGAHADFAITLDSSKFPHEIDARMLNGQGKGQVMRGIYKIENGALILRLPEKAAEIRPAGFDYVAGSSVMGFKARRRAR